MVKIERVDNELVKELNNIVCHEMKDPRLTDTMLSVTAVETAKDLRTAKVYVSVMDREKQKVVIKVLNDAAPYIRSLLFERLKIRTVPHFTFFVDNSFFNAMKIENLLKTLDITPVPTENSEENDE